MNLVTKITHSTQISCVKGCYRAVNQTQQFQKCCDLQYIVQIENNYFEYHDNWHKKFL